MPTKQACCAPTLPSMKPTYRPLPHNVLLPFNPGLSLYLCTAMMSS